MKIVMRELCSEEDKGSMGCQYVMNAARAAGYDMEYEETGDFDIELVSLHHVTNYPLLRALPRRTALRLVGGHPMAVNPRPIIPFADAVCIGDGETWIANALRALQSDFRVESLRSLPGTIIGKEWVKGTPLPAPNMEYPIPDHPAYLNKDSDGHAPTWYLEMARGCPFACHYCELGNTLKYRVKPIDKLMARLDEIDLSKSKRVSIFAPDEASHPGYGKLLHRIHERGMITQFGSMRIEQIMRFNLPLKPNMLIRVGMDGLTEETRYRVDRKQSDDYFVKYFEFMSERGHTNFKIFMIVGYPWEKSSDLDEWIMLIKRISRIERKTNAHIRIKVTPLIPQPTTPLANVTSQYDFEMIARIEKFIATLRPKRTPGWFFEQDGRVMNYQAWRFQCDITKGDESFLLKD